MNNFTPSVLTTHGAKRIDSRCSLTVEDVDKAFTSDQAVYVGKELGTRREHWVIWDTKEDKAVLIVRDWLAGSIVTILLEKYENKTTIPALTVYTAKMLTMFPDICPLDTINLRSLKDAYPDLKLKITAVLIPSSEDGRGFIRKMEFPLGKFQWLREPWRDPLFLEKIWSWEREGWDKQQIALRQIIIRLGKNEAGKSIIFYKKLNRPI